MTNEELTESDLRSMEEQIAAADAEIATLCNGKKWRMSIPAQPDSDSDLVISRALCIASELLKRFKGLAAASSSAPDQPFADLKGALRGDETDAQFEAATHALRESSAPAPQVPEAPHVNPDFAECWQSGWRAGWHAHGGISVTTPRPSVIAEPETTV